VLFEASKLSAVKKAAAANKIRTLKDIKLPELKYFNSSPCANHEVPNPACQQCGVIFRAHQRVGVAWLFLAEKGLLADSVGTGKTIQAAGTIAIMKQAGEFDEDDKVLVICRPAAVPQWEAQLNRLLKDVKVIVADGPKQKRVNKYLNSDWNVCVMSYQMLINDLESLELAFNFRAVFIDDVDPLRNGDTATSYAINRVSRKSARIPILTGTPLQKRLGDLYNVLQPLNVRDILGSPISFERRYLDKQLISEVNGAGKIVTSKKTVGYRNLGEFKEKIAHLTLRRTAADIDDVDLPAVIPTNVFLEPYPLQMEKYNDLKAGVLRIIKAEGTEVKRATAIAKFIYGAQICGGLAALGEADRPRTSIKLDWLEDKLVDGDLSEDKVVTFINFRNNVRALQARLDRAGVRYVTIWGENRNNADRYAAQQEFWENPDCKVLIGTTSIEQSLNLQIARHLVNVDMIMNPSRMEQLAGRIRRDGSTHSSVYVHNLLTTGTQEEGYLPALEREQALIDHIWDSRSELFAALSPLELLQMIGGNTR
jgi:SNF2 family DNA or RNA helicase